MNGRTHILAGTVCGLYAADVFQLTQPEHIAAIVAAAAFASLLPDSDHPHARINQIIPPLRLVAMVTEHRGATHGAIVPILMIAAALFVDMPALAGMALAAAGMGYASHILLDMLTKSGVQALYPYKKPLALLPKAARLRTGGIGELFIETCLMGIIAIQCVTSQYIVLHIPTI